MPNLVEDLGARYIRDFFNNAVFQMDGKVMKLRDVINNDVHVHEFKLDAKTPKWAAGIIQVDRLVDFTTFKWPKLGYRQVMQGDIGNIVVNVSSIRNGARGLRTDYIHYESLPVYQAVDVGIFDGWAQVNEARRVKEIFAPTFTSFSSGIKQLLAGECLAFAVSEDLAVGLSINQSADRGADIYFRGRVVGNVDENGNVTIVNKILQRDSIRKKLFQ